MGKNIRRGNIKHNRIRKLSKAEAAYLAGIIDGEGCISLRKRNNKIFPIVSIGNTSVELMDWLQTICVRRARKLAITKQTRSRCLMIEWGALLDVKNLLNQVIPFLIIKKERAIKAINIIEEEK